MRMKTNRMRTLLKESESTLGTHLINPWPGMVEVIGHTGLFDYIEFVGAYGSWDLNDLDNFVRATELFNMGSVFKVEEQLKGFAATRAVDAGFDAVLFADCRSAKEVKDSIALIRPETPEDRGVHGCGLRRRVCYDLGLSSSEEWLQVMRDVVIIVMIEKKGAMEELDAILEIRGVDMVQFGPGDYSITVGEPKHMVEDVQKRMIETALEKGVFPRVELAHVEDAEPYIKLGVRHFCNGWDTDMIKQYCVSHGTKMRELLKGK